MTDSALHGRMPALLCALALFALAAPIVVGCGSHFSTVPSDGGPGGAGGACSGCATGGTGGAAQACVSAADCASRTDGKNACNIATGACVGCIASTDCAIGDDCVSGTCQAGHTCSNSADCTGGQVCDIVAARCVECISSLECSSTQTCLGNVCRQACSTNSDCVRTGQLCNLTIGACVDCVLSSDCDRTQYCNQGTCSQDVCIANASTCDTAGSSIVTCNSDGSGTVTPVPCPTGQFCVRGGTTGVSCATRLCAPSLKGCDAAAENAILCSADGFSQQIVDDCKSKNEVCVSGECRAVVCPPSALFCSDQEVRRCSANGDSSTLVQTCGSGTFCNPSLAACSAQLCTPNGPACNGEISTTCNAQGSGYVTGGVDCASSGLHCFQGECRDQLCAPSTLFCSGNTVQLCNSAGTASTLYQSCTTTEYCDTATAACKAMICAPGQPTCNGNNMTTCNAQGSGYVSGGTSCGSLYCVSGSCQSALFAENFEDGDYAGWTPGTDTYTRSVTTAQAANGTAHSLVQTGGSTHQQGLIRNVPSLSPTNVSWWEMTTSVSYTGYFIVTADTTLTAYSSYIFYSYFTTDGNITTSSSVTTPYVINQWYHFEMRNINWSAHTFDWYINGALIYPGHTFSGSYSSIGRIDLYNFNSGTAYWDEITFQ